MVLYENGTSDITGLLQSPESNDHNPSQTENHKDDFPIEELVRLVQATPFLYDKRHRSNRNTQLKEARGLKSVDTSG